MFDFKELNLQFESYLSFATKYNNMAKECKKFFKENKTDIIRLQQEYDCLDFSTDAPKKFLRDNEILRNFNNMKFLKDYYESRRNDCLSQTSCCKQNAKITLLIDSELDNQYFYDTESKEILDLRDYQGKQIEFMITLLINANSFIGKVDFTDLSLISNIAFQINEEDIKSRNKYIYTEYLKTIKNDNKRIKHEERKRTFEFILNLKNEYYKNYQSLGNQYNENITDIYAFMILSGENMEKLFLCARDEDKDKIIDAYIKLSSYNEDNPYGINFRTSSQLINDETYLRIQKR